MTDIPLTPEEEDDALAGEYVLGVLDLADRSAAQLRIRRDTAFAARIARWEDHLGGLNDGYAEAEASAPELLARIEARLFPVAARPRRNWAGWLTGMALAGTLAIAAAVVLVPPDPEVVAVLSTKDKSLTYQLTHRGDLLTVTRVAGSAAPSGQVHELWIIAPGASPVSLGLLQDGPLEVSYPVPPEGWMFAVSVEPAGGSPSGLPTGPVILAAPVATDA